LVVASVMGSYLSDNLRISKYTTLPLSYITLLYIFSCKTGCINWFGR